MKTYFLFGEDACSIYSEDGIDGVVVAYEDNSITYETFCFDSEKNAPVELLEAFCGYGDYCVITEEEYNQL